MKPKFHNWYLAIFYLLGGGCYLLLLTLFMSWYVDAPEWFIVKTKLLFLPHILFCLALYVATELFELIYKKLC